jgi:hypothetical protein
VTGRSTRSGDAVWRLLPLLLVAAIVACGHLWLIQPSLSAYLRARSDAGALRGRVKTLQTSAARALALSPTDVAASLRDFDRRVSPDDRVADVAQALAEAVLDSAPPDTLRGFTIETGDRVQQAIGAGDRGADARVALFPYAVSYTPVRITFESTFESAGTFLWKLRDLPTLVELRSARMTRGLPLMRVEVLLYVFQRGEAMDASRTAAPGGATPGAAVVPRVADAAGGGG